MDFSGNHILSIDQIDRSDIEKLFAVADKLEPFASKEKITRVLEGAILGNMFFEPSTRTRISFGASFNLLGGNVREITEVGSSSLAKGESFADTAQVLSGYSDIIVSQGAGWDYSNACELNQSAVKVAYLAMLFP